MIDGIRPLLDCAIRRQRGRPRCSAIVVCRAHCHPPVQFFKLPDQEIADEDATRFRMKKKMKSERKKNGRRCLKDPPTCRRNVRIDVLVQFESADQVDLSTTSATCSTFFCRSGGRVVKHGSLKVGSWKKERSSFNGTISARQKLVSVKCFLKGKRRRRRRRTDLSIRERRRRK